MSLKRTVTVRADSGKGTSIDRVGAVLGVLLTKGIQAAAEFEPSDSAPVVVHYIFESGSDEEASKHEKILREYLDSLGYIFE